jgi:hypothetical protein
MASSAIIASPVSHRLPWLGHIEAPLEAPRHLFVGAPSISRNSRGMRAALPGPRSGRTRPKLARTHARGPLVWPHQLADQDVLRGVHVAVGGEAAEAAREHVVAPQHPVFGPAAPAARPGGVHLAHHVHVEVHAHAGAVTGVAKQGHGGRVVRISARLP